MNRRGILLAAGALSAVVAPRRVNFSGLVPVPGDGRYEWQGFLPILDLPQSFNPAKGFYNTSNEYQVPPGYSHFEAIHRTWTDPYRGQAVAETLGSGRKFTVADMVQLQNSDLSIPARSITPLLKDLDYRDPATGRAAARLLHWNFFNACTFKQPRNNYGRVSRNVSDRPRQNAILPRWRQVSPHIAREWAKFRKRWMIL